MATLARITDFTPATAILSGEVDAEFNQIVNALNSTNTNTNLIVRFSDPSVPVLRLDQLSIGPVQTWAVGGVIVATLTNTAHIQVAGKLISTIVTGTKPVDVVSTTLCDNLNADLLDGIQGSQFVRNDSGAQGVAGDFTITDTSPKLIFADSDGADFELEVNLDTCVLRAVGVADIFSIVHATQVLTFGAIPILPASNPTTDNQAARKKYIDDNAVFLTGDQSIAGIKTFTSIPILPASNPTTDNQASRKKYVDDSLKGIPKNLVVDTTTNSATNGDLTSFTIPAGTLPTDGDYIHFFASGFNMSNGESVTASIDGNTIGTISLGETGTVDWGFDILIVRLSATSVRTFSRHRRGHVNYNDGASAETNIASPDLAVADLGSSAIVFKCACTGTVSQKLLVGERVQR